VYKVLNPAADPYISVRKKVSMDSVPMEVLAGAAHTVKGVRLPAKTPQSCGSGQVTLFLSYPDWLSAWDSPWSCGHAAHRGPLEATDTCLTCPDWTPRAASDDQLARVRDQVPRET
jgi:hypothetical protein